MFRQLVDVLISESCRWYSISGRRCDEMTLHLRNEAAARCKARW